MYLQEHIIKSISVISLKKKKIRARERKRKKTKTTLAKLVVHVSLR